ncbi:MAG: glucose-6-phosphate dehydrogenase, partial [Dokdonella sp.]
TEVWVELKHPPQKLFPGDVEASPNHLRFRLSPEVLIALGTRIKTPGEGMVGEAQELIARDTFREGMLPYERLLGDALCGDTSLFTRDDSVEAAWRIIDPALANMPPVAPYAPGSWGPTAADSLITSPRGWHNPVLD